MRQKVKLAVLGMLSCIILLGLHSCSSEEPTSANKTSEALIGDGKSHPTKARQVAAMELAAKRVINDKIKVVSPNTAESAVYQVEEGSIKYDEQSQVATAPVKLTWRAKTNLLGGRDLCEIIGKIQISYLNQSKGILAVSFFPEEANAWTIECAKGNGKTKSDVLQNIFFNLP